MPSLPKIAIGFNKIARISDLSDLAEILFPNNKNHQFVFVLIYLELKWSDKTVSDLTSRIIKKGISKRTFERVRAKLRHLGIIDHISRFNKKHGYKEGFVNSNRFACSLRNLADRYEEIAQRKNEKDRLQEKFLLDILKARL